MKKGFCLVIVALMVLTICACSNQGTNNGNNNEDVNTVEETAPELESIYDVSYNGSTTIGTVINADSDFTVTGYYSDGSTKALDGWTVEETKLSAGNNTVYIECEGFTETVNINCPIMEKDKKYYASCKQIKKAWDDYCDEHGEDDTTIATWKTHGKTTADGEKGYTLGLMSDLGTMDANLVFRKGENSVKSLKKVPDTVKITGTVDLDTLSDRFPPLTYLCAIGTATLDGQMSFEDAYSFAEDAISGLRNSDVHPMSNGEIQVVSYDTEFDSGYVRLSMVQMYDSVLYTIIYFATEPEPVKYN